MDTYTLIVFAIIAAFVAVFWKAAQWAMNSTRISRDAESLTPADLEALRETCDGLVADLRSAADECTAQVEDAIRRARETARSLQQPEAISEAEPEAPVKAAGSTVTLFEHRETDAPLSGFGQSIAAIAEEQFIPEYHLPAETSFTSDLTEDSPDDAVAACAAAPEPSQPSAQGSVERIYELADEGLTWEEIARQEGRDPAEVKLFLGLRQMRSNADHAA